ncbi:hypothetical protein EE074_29615, partial [Klebsiella pneumoniae]|uniref:hypothetical protein n=1 Tax=Klebsiella pneumoniae TaxID=573 RepID=UPI001D0F1FBC
GMFYANMSFAGLLFQYFYFICNQKCNSFEILKISVKSFGIKMIQGWSTDCVFETIQDPSLRKSGLGELERRTRRLGLED